MFGKNHLIRQLALLVLLIMVGGSVGYTRLEEGWSLFDGFYMTLITLTTIGFGEVHELSDKGRALTALIIIFGLGSGATIFSQLAHMMMEGNVLKVWRRRRMEKKLARMKDHVIICGYGRIGNAICKDLTAQGVLCVIIDRDEGRWGEAREMNIPVLSGNATSDSTLTSAGVTRAAILVAALSNDSDNLFVALAARDLNPGLVVIARGEDKSIETRMLRAGVDRVVYPAQLGGGQIARLISAELGRDPEEDRTRRVTDVMGYDLQVYRNFNEKDVTVGRILETTGSLRAVAHIDQENRRFHDPGPDRRVGAGETVVLINEVGTAHVAGSDAGAGGIADRSELQVGIPAIDEEHGQILQLATQLKELRPDRDRKTVAGLLTELRDFALKHFHHEERLLLSADFPDAEAHIRHHRALAEKLDNLIDGDGDLHPANVAELLETWFRSHILEEDRKYADHLAGAPTP